MVGAMKGDDNIVDWPSNNFHIIPRSTHLPLTENMNTGEYKAVGNSNTDCSDEASERISILDFGSVFFPLSSKILKIFISIKSRTFHPFKTPVIVLYVFRYLGSCAAHSRYLPLAPVILGPIIKPQIDDIH